MELHAQDGQNTFTPERASRSLEYWRDAAQRILADPGASGSDAALKSYSHDAVSAANLLAAHNFASEAEQAYRLAAQLWPENPESIGGLADVHVELQRTHFHSAIRLETMQGVQHISQWRVQFEPQTESVVVHWARIRRGEEQIDYTQPDRFRILQREEGLDSFVVDGTFTLLLVLEDVCFHFHSIWPSTSCSCRRRGRAGARSRGSIHATLPTPSRSSPLMAISCREARGSNRMASRHVNHPSVTAGER